MTVKNRLMRKPKEFNVWEVGTEHPKWVDELVKAGEYAVIFLPTNKPLEQTDKDMILLDRNNNQLVAGDYVFSDDENKEVIGVKADKYAAFVETGFDEVTEEVKANEKETSVTQTPKRRATRKPRTTTKAK